MSRYGSRITKKTCGTIFYAEKFPDNRWKAVESIKVKKKDPRKNHLYTLQD